MSRRSRRGQGSTISLFSFQDVMMTVMGILILITLLMSLELTNALAQNAGPPVMPTQVPNQQSLERELEQLRQRYENMKRYVTRMAKVSGSGRNEFESHKQQLEDRYAEIRSLQQQVAQMKKQLPAKVAVTERVREALADAQRIEIQATQLRQRLDNQRQNPHLSYILQSGQHKQPIICILSDRRIGLGTVDTGTPAIWFTHVDSDAQLSSLKRFLGRCDPDRQFVVILLKPSAFNQRYVATHDAIVSVGFQVGLDLISEETSVLPADER